MNPSDFFSKQMLSSMKISDWGYTEKVEPKSFEKYKNWVEEGKSFPLKYLSDNRMNIRSKYSNYFKEYQSAIVFLFDYSQIKKYLNSFYSSEESNGLKIASYALGFSGLDYHFVIRQHLEEVQAILEKRVNGLKCMQTLDMHPVLERDLAFQAGLGFFGKNSNLISIKHGSYFLIGSLLLNQKLKISQREIDVDHCGTCTKCIDLCPTDAIDNQTRTINVSKCISTYTIEYFKDDQIPPDGMNQAGGEIFGCDICQDVCPWNLKQINTTPLDLDEKSHELINFFLRRSLDQIIDDLDHMSNKKFKRVFKGTAFERTGRVGILKNIKLWAKLRNSI